MSICNVFIVIGLNDLLAGQVYGLMKEPCAAWQKHENLENGQEDVNLRLVRRDSNADESHRLIISLGVESTSLIIRFSRQTNRLVLSVTARNGHGFAVVKEVVLEEAGRSTIQPALIRSCYALIESGDIYHSQTIMVLTPNDDEYQ